MNLNLREVTAADIPRLIEVEQESFPDPHWQAQHFLGNDCVVAEADGCILGFLVSRQVFAGDQSTPPEREILNLAVAKPFRRMGVATALLRHELGRQATFFLEVRESNRAARALYAKFGFQEVGRRPYYYRYPDETAIVMNMK